MQNDNRPVVIGLGEVLWDVFGDERRAGGAPANVAFHAQQLGLRGVICSRVGQDPAGDELVQLLKSQGLETEFIQRDAKHPTGLVTVDTTLASGPKYTIHENVAWDFLEFDARTERLVEHAQVICFGTLAQRNEASRETIEQCLAAADPACLLVYDVNLRQTWYAREQVVRSLSQASIVKLNADEVVVLAPLLGIDYQTLEEFGRAMLTRFELSLVCITQAEHGCLIVAPDGIARAPGIPVRVADTVGAGDAFTAAMIAARLRHCSLGVIAQFANEVGAMVASSAGGMPQLGEPLKKLIAKYLGR